MPVSSKNPFAIHSLSESKIFPLRGRGFPSISAVSEVVSL